MQAQREKERYRILQAALQILRAVRWVCVFPPPFRRCFVIRFWCSFTRLTHMRPPWPRPWPRPTPIPDQFQFQSQQQQVTTSAMRRRGCAVAVGFAIVVANTVAVAVAVTVADAASRAAAAECLRNGKRYLCTSVQGELSSCSVWFLLVPLVDFVLTSLGLDRFCRVVSPYTPPKKDQETFSFKNLRDSFVLVLVRYVKCIWWRRKQSKSLRKKHNIINVKQKRSWSPSTANQPINKPSHTHTHTV